VTLLALQPYDTTPKGVKSRARFPRNLGNRKRRRLWLTFDKGGVRKSGVLVSLFRVGIRMTVTDREMYSTFVALFRFCWACGAADPHRGDLFRLQNAHIVGGPGRRADRRAIARLCQRCHALNHGARIKVDGIVLPHLMIENLLWLKMVFDNEYFDRAYLQSLRTKRLEPLVPVEPDEWFGCQWLERAWIPPEILDWVELHSRR